MNPSTPNANSGSSHDSLIQRLTNILVISRVQKQNSVGGRKLNQENVHDLEIQAQQKGAGAIKSENRFHLVPITDKENMTAMVDRSKKDPAASEIESIIKRQEKEKKNRETQQIELEALKRRRHMAREQRLLDEDEVARNEFLKKYAERNAQIHQNQDNGLHETNPKPWLSLWKHTIKQIDAAAAKRSEIQEFLKEFSDDIHNEDLYKKNVLRTPDIMMYRATLSFEAEKTVNQFNKNKTIKELIATIFEKENFHGMAYEVVKRSLSQSQTNEKRTWTYLIACDPFTRYSTDILAHKFDLDKESGRKTSSYGQVDICTNLITSSSQINQKIKGQVKALIFVVPEKRTQDELHDDVFWETQRGRLSRIIKALTMEQPDFNCPLLVIYRDYDSSNLYNVLYKMPETLNFKEQKAITDYHILVMHKETIAIRICEEMIWLFKNSI